MTYAADGGSHMERSLVDRQSRFLDRLVQGRMAVEGPRYVLCGSAKFHGHNQFVDQIAGIRPDDMEEGVA